MSQFCKAFYKSPIGTIEILGNAGGIASVTFVKDDVASGDGHVPECLKGCVTQIDEYFNGKRKEFDVKLQPQGTAFQRTVWDELQAIPFGSTASYSDIAKKIGNPKAVRAVGAANGKNKIYIIIPCHRIIGSNGQLTGYAGELWRKKWLLEHEKGF